MATPVLANDTPFDRLCGEWACLALNGAGQVELFTVLDVARQRLRRLRSEDPNDLIRTVWDLRDEAGQMVAQGRRRDVLPLVRKWLPDVLALTDAEYRTTLPVWRQRAEQAVAASKERYQAGVRA